MKIYLYLLVAFLFAFFGCKNEEEEHNSFSDKISSTDAEALIKSWIFNEYNPEMNPSLQFSFEEITTDETWNKLNGQIYTIFCEVPGLSNRGVFIKKNKVFDLGRYNLLGVNEISNIIVTNLDNDANSEICFTLVHGSGILRTNVICYINGLDDSYLLADSTFFYTDKIKLSKDNFQNVNVLKVENNIDFKIGKIIISDENEVKVLKFKPE